MNQSTIPSNRFYESVLIGPGPSVRRIAEKCLTLLLSRRFSERKIYKPLLTPVIRAHVFAPMPVLIKKLNDMLRGWANHVVASEAFSCIDTYVFDQLRRMLRQRHPAKTVQWLIKNYWSAAGKNVFAVTAKTAKAGKKIYQVVRVCATEIRRYVKIKAAANPYLPEYAGYFWRRRHERGSKLLPAMSAREYRAMAIS